MKKVKFLGLAIFAVALVSCGGDKKIEGGAAETSAPAETAAPAPAAENTFTIEANDAMTYSTNEIKAKAGQPITVTLKNIGTMPVQAMGHNFIVLKQGTDVDAFVKAAQGAKDTDYIPAGAEKDAIIAHTKLLGPGQSDTITFTVDKPGTYDYLCSFPAHYMTGMKGKLIVE